MTIKVTNYVLIFYSLIIIVIVSDDIYAGSSMQNVSRADSTMIQNDILAANDTTGSLVEEVRERPWTVSVPIWIPGYTGRFTVGGVEVGGEPDGDFWDRLFSSELGLDFYFVGLINYNWQKWDFQANIFSGTIGKSAVFTLDNNREVSARLDLVMPNMYAAYDFLHKSAPLGPITNWRAYLGGRLYFVNIDFNLSANSSTKEGRSTWFTVIFGTHMTIKIIDRVRLMLSGDIGGFLHSGSPNLFGSANVHYQPWQLFSVSLGYAAIRIVRVRTNPDDMGLKAVLAGPVLGIAFHF